MKKPTSTKRRTKRSGPQSVKQQRPSKPSAPLLRDLKEGKIPHFRPSGAETKMKQNAAEGRTGEVGVKVLTRIQELELRSHYLQAKLFESQYIQARDRHIAQFDSAPEAVQTRQQIKKAGETFNAALEAVHREHGTSNETHVYDMDAKELRPKDKLNAVPAAVTDAKPMPVPAAKEGSDAKEEGEPVDKGTTDT